MNAVWPCFSASQREESIEGQTRERKKFAEKRHKGFRRLYWRNPKINPELLDD